MWPQDGLQWYADAVVDSIGVFCGLTGVLVLIAVIIRSARLVRHGPDVCDVVTERIAIHGRCNWAPTVDWTSLPSLLPSFRAYKGTNLLLDHA